MTGLQIQILAIVQGITEFLPISSSAHLLTISKVLQWPDQGLAIDVAVHVGTVLSVLVYFYRDVFLMICGFRDSMSGRQNDKTHFLWTIVYVTIPVIIAGYFLKEYTSSILRTDSILTLIAWTSIIFGFLLWFVDKTTSTVRLIKHLNFGHIIFLGVAQTLALIPGVSRSGIFMTAGRLIGMERPEVARLAILSGIPTLLGAGVLIGYDIYIQKSTTLTIDFFWAVAMSFIAGLITLSVFMDWLRKSSMVVFAIYRIIFGIALLLFVV